MDKTRLLIAAPRMLELLRQWLVDTEGFDLIFTQVDHQTKQLIDDLDRPGPYPN